MNHSDKKNSFRHLHCKTLPLVLTNIWDAASAKIVETSGAKALATSSASLARSLGYSDGYQLPEADLIDAIKRIQRVIELPLSADIENGFSGNAKDVVTFVVQLVDLGVVGINIEDGTAAPELLAEKIAAIKAKHKDLFINARCDVLLAGLTPEAQKTEETLKRLRLYKSAGANGVFIQGLTDTTVAKQIQHELSLPANLMAEDDAQINEFTHAGIERISIGPGSFYKGLSEFAAV